MPRLGACFEALHATHKTRWHYRQRARSTASRRQRCSAVAALQDSGSFDSAPITKKVHTHTDAASPRGTKTDPAPGGGAPQEAPRHRGAEKPVPRPTLRARGGRPKTTATVKRPSGGGGSPSKMKLREMNDWKISNDTLKLGVELGRGSFGIVMAAEW